jgi:hypothetical protein
MKSIVKWMALLAILATAGKCFMDSFLPEYESWREKYPPEPEEEDEEADENAAQVVSAQDLFKPDEAAFKADSPQ